jgi:putative toxin-antitoxin system antitoxin component (TIGR02293 family)
MTASKYGYSQQAKGTFIVTYCFCYTLMGTSFRYTFHGQMAIIIVPLGTYILRGYGMSTKDIVAILGGAKALRREVRTNADFISVVREGLPTRAVRSLLLQSNITQDEAIQALHISRRTFTRRMRATNFEPIESEKLLRLARIYAFAKEVFDGNAEKTVEWLRRPNRALGAQKPISLLDSDLGAQQVEDTLGRLQEGVYS